MFQGDKASYSDKQRRVAERIKAGYEKRGFTARAAEEGALDKMHKLVGGHSRDAAVPAPRQSSVTFA